VEGDGVFERNGGIERQLEHGGAAAANQEKDKGVLPGALEQVEGLARSLEGLGVGEWMASGVVTDAPGVTGRDFGRGADSAQVELWREPVEERVGHGERGLAEGNDEELPIFVERNDDGLGAGG